MKFDTIEKKFIPTEDGKCAVGKRGMVSTAFPDATEAGVQILQEGGNAIDAACAAALALSVCEPQASGIGGQSMAILHYQGNTIAIDGSSRAPSLAHIDHFKNKDVRLHGHRATTVPTTLAVLAHLNFKYGKLAWKKIVEPAIRIAKEGYQITKLQSELQHRELENFAKVESKEASHYFLKEARVPYEVGDIFKQSDLAAVLDQIAEAGARDFYRGDIAQSIERDMIKYDGFLRADDLALIPWPVEREPLKRKYRGLTVCTTPPPSSGRTLLLVLNMLNHLPSKIFRKMTPEAYHFMAETFRKSLLNRKERPFEANTYPQIDDKKLNSFKFARDLARSIRDTIDPDLPIQDPLNVENDTTHLSVMDEEGNCIGITQSIERVYGANVACEGLGFLYNNYMSAMETQDPSHPYYLRPNSQPWTTVSPIIVFNKETPWMVAGSPGSERIFSTVAQFLSHMIDEKKSMGEAMMMPRFHATIGGYLHIEAEAFEKEILDYLTQVGYKVKEREKHAFFHGAIHAVLKCASKDEFQGVAEIRRDGTAKGVF